MRILLQTLYTIPYDLAGHATNWKTFREATQQNLGQEKPEYFTTKATIAFVKRENCMYMVRRPFMLYGEQIHFTCAEMEGPV